MKTKTEDIVMQEMNLCRCYSQLRLIDDELRRLGETRLDLLVERAKLEVWFADRDLPLPKRYE